MPADLTPETLAFSGLLGVFPALGLCVFRHGLGSPFHRRNARGLATTFRGCSLGCAPGVIGPTRMYRLLTLPKLKNTTQVETLVPDLLGLSKTSMISTTSEMAHKIFSDSANRG